MLLPPFLPGGSTYMDQVWTISSCALASILATHIIFLSCLFLVSCIYCFLIIHSLTKIIYVLALPLLGYILPPLPGRGVLFCRSSSINDNLQKYCAWIPHHLHLSTSIPAHMFLPLVATCHTSRTKLYHYQLCLSLHLSDTFNSSSSCLMYKLLPEEYILGQTTSEFLPGRGHCSILPHQLAAHYIEENNIIAKDLLLFSK